MRSVLSWLALVCFIAAEGAPQRRNPSEEGGNRTPILGVRGIFSQIQDLRNNINENRRRIVDSIAEPIGRLGRPPHGHRKSGRPGVKDKPLEDTKKSEEEPKNGPVASGAVRPPPAKGSTPPTPADVKDKPLEETKKSEEEPKDRLPLLPGGELPPPPPPVKALPSAPPPQQGGGKPTTEDWSDVSIVPAPKAKDADGGPDELKRKIIGAPCLGGLDHSGNCRAAFD